MKLTFWGVRGSIPTPGETTRRFGGNTTCISVEVDDHVLVIDAGTGIGPLGRSLVSSEKEISILLTHLHADHLQGFPFFAPLYLSDRRVNLLDLKMGDREYTLLSMLDGVHFPLLPEDLAGDLHRVRGDAVRFLNEKGIAIERVPVNHPGGAYGYRLTGGERTIVFIPDNELRGPRWGNVTREQTVEFCRGADILIHDAQYLAPDMPHKWGWGHSTLEHACDLARDAEVSRLVLFHHDPSRSDDMLDEMREQGGALLGGTGITCTVAAEGTSL
jgi:phosphoribosyl 1,2-cyclic phosphodiesterase